MSVVIAVVIFAVGIAVGWFVRGSNSLPSDVPTVAVYDGWRLSCPAASQADRSCAISNDLQDSKSGRRIAQMVIARGKTGPVLVVTVPFDVLLPAGVGLAVGDAKPRTYPYQICNQSGCIAEIPFGDDLRAAMHQPGQGKLIVASLSRKSVSILFPLKGFARADEAMSSRQNGHNLFGMAS